MLTIELSCLGVLVVAAALRARAAGAGEWLASGPIIAVAAWVGEDTAIRFYGFYAYDPGWHLFVDRVPVMIPLIWVFVVLSARDVARALGGPLATVAFALIVFDAALIEPCATSAGLWRWFEPGAFRVPFIGILGWACFGASALFWLTRLPGRWRWLTVVLAPLSMHALLVVLWWGALRWVGRSEAPAAGLAVAAWALAAAALAGLLVARRARTLPLPLILPRLGPAGFFLLLLAMHEPPVELWAYAAAFVPPWVLATSWTRKTKTAEHLSARWGTQ